MVQAFGFQHPRAVFTLFTPIYHSLSIDSDVVFQRALCCFSNRISSRISFPVTVSFASIHGMSDTVEQLQNIITIMAKLRDPETGCPWDVKQDFASIAPYTIEEA